MGDDISKKYQEMEKKYKLPKFEELDASFHISELDDSKHLLADIRERIFDKVHNYSDFLSELLQPDTNLISLYESRVFNDDEKKGVYDTFRHLMVWRREALKMSISNNEASDAKFISEFSNEWKSLGQKIVEVIDRVKAIWENDSEETEKLGYFG